MHIIPIKFQKAQSRILMVVDLVSYKLQLLVSLICMHMHDMCHLRMHRKNPINSHHVLAPLTFFLAHAVSSISNVRVVKWTE